MPQIYKFSQDVRLQAKMSSVVRAEKLISSKMLHVLNAICRVLFAAADNVLFLLFLSFLSLVSDSVTLSCLIRVRSIPCLPPKSYFSRFDREVINSRQEGLQDFINEWVSYLFWENKVNPGRWRIVSEKLGYSETILVKFDPTDSGLLFRHVIPSYIYRITCFVVQYCWVFYELCLIHKQQVKILSDTT